MPTVCPIPPRDPQNPYLELLYDSMEETTDFELVEVNFSLVGLLAGREQIDVAHMHWLPGFSLRTASLPVALVALLRFYVMLRILRYRSAVFVWTGHNVWPHEIRHRRLELIARRHILDLADLVFVHCERGKEEFRIEFQEDVDYRVVEHGTYEDYYQAVPSRSESRELLGVDSDAVVFLTFGILRRYKGQAKLARIFDESTSDAELVIAGKPEEERVAREIERVADSNSRIRFDSGFIPAEEVPHYYSACDYVVLPYESILMSGNLMLAFSMGRPVIAPSKGCLPHYITEDSGILYDGDDDLRRLLATLEKRNETEFEAGVIREYSRGFDWKTIAREHASAYRSKIE